jgi:predicted Zn finger-like uncharacterized protein
MLVTTCKHCGARFRVLPGQLNQRQGQVRCGECLKVFNGFESLKGYRVDDSGLQLAYPQQEAEPAFVPEREAPGDTAAVPEAAEAAAMEAPAPPAPEAEAEAEPEVSAAPAEDRTAAPAVESPVVAAAAPFEAFVPAAPPRPARAWTFGIALLVLTLGLQLAFAYRAELARQYPPLRPALESACEPIGCTVAWANDEAALKLEESELVEVPGKPGQIALLARIRNLSSAPQQFPHVELTLSDLSGQTAIRKVLRPTDYLGRPPAPGEVMAAGSETQLSLRFDTGNAKPTGYELLLFYP